MNGSGSPLARVLPHLPAAAAVALCVALLGWLQFSFAGLEDSDSYFHTRAARELDLHGVRKSFPQTVYSTWSSRYSDKDWLFHVALIPFQRLSLPGGPQGAVSAPVEDLATPAKQAMVAFSLLYFAALALCLHAVRARLSWLWLLLLFTSSAHLIWALLPVRPGILGVTLLLVEIALFARRRGPLLAVAGALHTWSHSSFFLLPVLAAVGVAAALLRRERPPLRLAGWALAGPLFASVVHPYFPNNLLVAWDQLAVVAGNLWFGVGGIPRDLFGGELGGMPTTDFIGWFPTFLPALFGLLAILAAGKRISTEALALLMMTTLLLAAGFLSYRFMEFFLPVVVVLGARLWSELAGEERLAALARRAPAGTAVGALALAACLGAGLAKNAVGSIHRGLQGSVAATERQRPAIEFLRGAAAPDEIVYHNFWFAFSVLYHFRPDGRYIEAADPVFLYRFDRRLFDESRAILDGTSPDLYAAIRGDFGARWVYLTRGSTSPRALRQFAADQRFVEAYQDEDALIYRVE